MQSNKINILVIDNHKFSETHFVEFFNKLFFNIYMADGIENGIEIATRYIPDIIICSITISELGEELVKNILSKSNICFTPIFYISNLNGSYYEYRKIMNLGVTDYFPKDFDPSDLIKSVNIRVKQNLEFKNQLIETCQQSFEINNLSRKDHVLITIGKKLQLVKYEEIVCITTEKEYSKIRTRGGKSLIIRKSLKNWLEVLPTNIFLRIHRKSIINVNFIDRIEKIEPRSYVVYLKTVLKPFELSRRYSCLMKKTFGVNF